MDTKDKKQLVISAMDPQLIDYVKKISKEYFTNMSGAVRLIIKQHRDLLQKKAA